MEIVDSHYPSLDGDIVYSRVHHKSSEDEADDDAPPPQRGVQFPPLPGPGKAAKWMFAPCMAPYAKLDVPVEKMAFLLCRQKHLNESAQAVYNKKHQMLKLAGQDFSMRDPFAFQGNSFRFVPDLVMQVIHYFVLHFTINGIGPVPLLHKNQTSCSFEAIRRMDE